MINLNLEVLIILLNIILKTVFLNYQNYATLLVIICIINLHRLRKHLVS